MIIGSYIPNVNTSMTIQVFEDCGISAANNSDVISLVSKKQEITVRINREFQNMNQQLQSRLVSLLNLCALEKYELFLKDYPGVLNRIPHYYEAQFLGITPTHLSRVRNNL